MTPSTSTAAETEDRLIITEPLVWRGITLSISYEADWLGSGARGSDYAVAHLEIHVVRPERAPLPVTETGYRSHFLAQGVVEEAGGPAAFASAALDEAAERPAWREAEKQVRIPMMPPGYSEIMPPVIPG